MPHKDPAARRVSQAAWRATHPTYAAAYYATHREEKRAYNAVYHISHRDMARALCAAYDAAHREDIRIRQAVFRAAHPEKRRENAHRRRARIRGQFVAPVDAAAIYTRDRGRCHLCGKHVKQTDVSMDHLIPISLGGVHAPHNVALAHLKCNLRRNNRGPAQLLLKMEGC